MELKTRWITYCGRRAV